jgi:hypothetical protein
MTRKSRREIERALEDLDDTTDDGETDLLMVREDPETGEWFDPRTGEEVDREDLDEDPLMVLEGRR